MSSSRWTLDPRYSCWFIRGSHCLISLEARPAYCDRGNWIARLDSDPGSDLARDLDDADLWPRYYFDEERARLECEAWLRKRGQWAEPPASHVDIEDDVDLDSLEILFQMQMELPPPAVASMKTGVA